jgi:hypothetical protein
VLCTEILRSSREREDQKQLKRLQRLDTMIEDQATSAADRKAHKDERAAIQTALVKRNVEVYGTITLRTNGRRLVVAFRMEKERLGRSPKRWQTYWFRHDPGRGFIPFEDGGGH